MERIFVYAILKLIKLLLRQPLLSFLLKNSSLKKTATCPLSPKEKLPLYYVAKLLFTKHNPFSKEKNSALCRAAKTLPSPKQKIPRRFTSTRDNGVYCFSWLFRYFNTVSSTTPNFLIRLTIMLTRFLLIR